MKALWRLLPYYRPYRGRFIGGLALVILSSGLAGVIPWLLRAAIDGLRAGMPPARIQLIAVSMIAIALVSGTARYGMRELMNGVSRWIEYDLRNALFRHLASLDASFFAAMRTGDIMARLTNDLGAVRMAVGPAIMYLVNTIAGGAFALVFMLHIDPRLTLVALLPVILLPVVMARGGRAIHNRFEAVQEHFSTMTTRAQENIAGARIVRAYRQEEPEIARLSAMNEEYVRRNMRLVRLWGLLNPGFSLLAGVGGVVVLGYGGRLVLRGDITVGSLVAFGFYLAMLTWPLIALGWVTNLFQRGAASMARLNEILRAQSLDRGTRHAAHAPARTHGSRDRVSGRWIPLPGQGGRRSPLGAPGRLLLGSRRRDARRRRRDRQRQERPDRSDPARARPAGGRDPHRRRADSRAAAARPSRRDRLCAPGHLPVQRYDRANLAYGTDDGGGTEWAARVAQLDRTIAEFPAGYETLLGERGINLSGGQKQRAALARALARRPSIVLLDDALSAVDSHTEAEILHGLRDALSGRTTMIASHRISAIREASWIIVLDEGRIVEEGRHADLFAAGGRYWSLLNRQLLEDSIERESDVLSPGALSQ